jgi:hypothetical protein
LTTKNKREITSFTLKIAGVVALVRAAAILLLLGVVRPRYVSLASSHSALRSTEWFVLSICVLAILLAVLAGWVFLSRSERLAARMFPEQSTTGTTSVTVPAPETQSIMLLVGGAFLFVSAMPRLLEAGFILLASGLAEPTPVTFSAAHRSWFSLSGDVFGVTEAGLGLVLFLRALLVSGFWQRNKGRRSFAA